MDIIAVLKTGRLIAISNELLKGSLADEPFLLAVLRL